MDESDGRVSDDVVVVVVTPAGYPLSVPRMDAVRCAVVGSACAGLALELRGQIFRFMPCWRLTTVIL